MRSLPDAFFGGWVNDKLTEPWIFPKKTHNDGTEKKQKKNTHTSDVWSKYVWLIFGKHVPFKDDMLLIATKILFQLKFALKLCMFSGPFPVGGATPPLGFPNPPFVFRFVSSLACGELWGWASEERFTGTPWVKLTAAFCRLPLENGSWKLP